jgi:23S rRNA (cytidine1920-2'-O)/16S rRNA (cytidine1409-2'-O)-methyltransferase
MSQNSEPSDFVSRGGQKLAAALDAFSLNVTGFACADLGCNVGGFTDCLLQRGADHVVAIDTGYGALAWKLRNDDRVTVLERTNAMHLDESRIADCGLRIELVTIDLGWTRQKHAIPAALKWSPKQIITLIKPHYEANERGILDDDHAAKIAQQTLEQMPELGVDVIDSIQSPLRGGKGKGKAGNIEYLALLQPHA